MPNLFQSIGRGIPSSRCVRVGDQKLGAIRIDEVGGVGVAGKVIVDDAPALGMRGVHMDFKGGAPPRAYLEGWLEKMARWQFNTLLIEYEDRFPYEQLPFLRSPSALDREELEGLLNQARGLGFQIIPLVPTLGHVEFALKHDKLAHLRADGFLTELDVRNPDALAFACGLMDEILALHGPDEWVHVGGDETWNLRNGFQQHLDGLGESEHLYAEHMAAVCGYARACGKRVMLFDDMVRSMNPGARAATLARIPSGTAMAIWHYNSSALSDHKERDQLRAAAREYREAGHHAVFLPCHNWGPSVPYYADFCIENILQMTRLALEEGALGCISTAWAVFQVPWPLADLGAALAADKMWGGSLIRDNRLTEEAYAWEEFGLTDRRVVDAIYMMDSMIELETDLGRPIHLPYFYYMDAVLHYGNQRRREMLGPVIEEGVECHVPILNSKLEQLERSPRREEALLALERMRDASMAAREVLESALQTATRGRTELRFMADFAWFRAIAARRMLFFAGASAESLAAIRRENQAVHEAMQKSLSPYFRPREMELFLGWLFKGETALLEGAGQRVAGVPAFS